MKGWLAAIIVGLLGALGFYRERSKRLKQDIEDAEAESEALHRQTEALNEQKQVATNAIDEARDTTFTPDSINDILRDKN